jgi:hypothetical protein
LVKINLNILYKIPAIIYKSFDTRGVDIPHFRAIMTIVLIIFFHAVHIGLIFNISSDFVMPWSSKENKQNQWLYASIYFGSLIGFISIVFRKSKLDQINVTQSQLDRANKILPFYLAVCLILAIILLIKLGLEKGKINI